MYFGLELYIYTVHSANHLLDHLAFYFCLQYINISKITLIGNSVTFITPPHKKLYYYFRYSISCLDFILPEIYGAFVGRLGKVSNTSKFVT